MGSIVVGPCASCCPGVGPNTCCPGCTTATTLYVYPMGGGCAITGQRIPIVWDGVSTWIGNDSTVCNLTYKLQCLAGIWSFNVFNGGIPCACAGQTQVSLNCCPPGAFSLVISCPGGFACCSCGAVTFTILDV